MTCKEITKSTLQLCLLIGSRQCSGSEINSELEIRVRGRLRVLVLCTEHALRFGG